MADTLTIVDFNTGGRPVTVFDLEQINAGTAGVVIKERDSFKIQPAEGQGVESSGSRRWDGSRTVAQRYGNAQVSARWWIRGATAQAALDNAATFLELIRNANIPGRYIRWTPVGNAAATYFEIRGPGTWTPDYSAIRFEQNYSIAIDGSWPVAPLAEMDRMDVFDDFSVDTLGTYAGTVMADAPVLYLRLGEASGTVAKDISGNALDGTYNATPTLGVTGALTGDADKAVTFNGSTHYITVSDNEFLDCGDNLSVSFWIKTSGSGTYRIIDKGSGAFSVLMVAGKIRLDSSGSTNIATTTVNVNDGVYHHVVVTKNRAAVKIWIDKVDRTGTVTNSLLLDNAINLAIGRAAGSAIDFLNGTLDEIAIYSYALSAERVAAHFDAGRGTFTGHRDWTFVAGAGTLSPVNGDLIPTDTTNKQLYHSGRGYQHSDVQATLRFRTGATVSGSVPIGIRARWDTVTNSRVDAIWDGTSAIYARAFKYDASQQESSAGGATLVANTTYWLRLRTEGNTITTELFSTEPSPNVTPLVSTSTNISGASNPAIAESLGRGVKGEVGLYLTPPGTDWRYESFEILPYTYRLKNLPETLDLTNIPGDDGAPAKVGLEITPSGGSAPVWGLFSWWREENWNRVWNGDFEVDVAGWFGGTGGTFLPNLPNGVARNATVRRFGVASLEIATDADSEGVQFNMYGRFKLNVPYTLKFWAKSDGVKSIRGRLVQGGGGVDAAESATIVLTVPWQEITVTWVPNADRDYAHVSLLQFGAGALTSWYVDGVQVYEGTVPSTRRTQIEGRGALPAVGILSAANAASLTTWAIVSDSNYRIGYGIRTTTSGAGTASAEWLVDPNIVDYGLFPTHGEIDVEVWARMELAASVVSPQLYLYTGPESGTTYGVNRFTPEYGNLSGIGKLVTKPSTGSVFRLVRLGTLTFYVDKNRPARWRLKLNAAWAGGSSGSFGINALYIVPIDRRAVTGPTGVVLGSDYPKLAWSTSETIRTFDQTGMGLAAKPGQHGSPAPGLSKPIEMEPGNVKFLSVLSSLVPDDPTSDATSEAEDYAASLHYQVVPRVHLARGT